MASPDLDSSTGFPDSRRNPAPDVIVSSMHDFMASSLDRARRGVADAGAMAARIRFQTAFPFVGLDLDTWFARHPPFETLVIVRE